MIQVVRTKTQVALTEVTPNHIYLLEDRKDGSLWLLRCHQEHRWAWYPLMPVGTMLANEPQSFEYLMETALHNSEVAIWEFEQLSEVYAYAARCARGK